jgi:hypothetical protein
MQKKLPSKISCLGTFKMNNVVNEYLLNAYTINCSFIFWFVSDKDEDQSKDP